MEIDVISDPCAIWLFTGGGLVAAKGGYHYVAFSPGNNVLNRSRGEKREYETKSPGTIIRGELWFVIKKAVNHLWLQLASGTQKKRFLV